ncbi:hypothetical protein [Kutzneria buriramensis]|uniref:hypothetical protein n=1 Tax=Kutzneria buriramensis TaxID=1045776 RepID=UPI000E25ED00|nr:hypothetical protein [Kutzneria buriramensis]
MPSPVTIAGSVTCGHPASKPPPDHGKAALSSTAKLTVDGKPVLPFTAAALLGPYVGCSFQAGTVVGPCTVTTPVSGGSSTKVTVANTPVLLDSLVATSQTPPPPATVTVSAGQTKLTAS